MNIHEYQAKQLLSRFGVAIKDGGVATTAAEARQFAEAFLSRGFSHVVIKAQIHAGGRGKGVFRTGLEGGVRLATSADEIAALAEGMLGQVLVTQQTGPEGRPVQKILLETAPPIRHEYYLAVLLDRSISRPIVMASAEGGVDIEEVAARSPEKIHRIPVDPAIGLMPHQARRLAVALGLRGGLLAPTAKLIHGAYQAWWECDASLVEINPLGVVQMPDGTLTPVAVDAKMAIEDNGLGRHPELVALRDLNEEAPLEIEASKYQLSYIKLDGDIACLVNGAGLAMATMDIIQHYGGQPANFLDVGGGATTDQVAAAFKIIRQDPNVRAILVNIFGGIMDCDVIARGIVTAAHETGIPVPLVVRLEGNNVQAGRQTLAQSGLPIVPGDSMADAADKVVQAARASPTPS